MKYFDKNGEVRDPFNRPWMYNNCVASTDKSGVNSSHQFVKGILDGGVTGVASTLVTYPTDFLKTKLQLRDRSVERLGYVEAFKRTINKRGFFGLYRGAAVVIYFSIPKYGIRFGTYETIKERVVDEKGNLSPEMRLFCGLMAGIVESIIIATPIETIKTKVVHDFTFGEDKYKGLFHAISEMFKEEGIKGIYRGLFPTTMRQGCSLALRFFAMDTMKSWYRAGDPSLHIPVPIIGVFGVLAGLFAVVLTAPIDIVKTRMQGMEAAKYKHSLDCVVKIWKNEGTFGLFSGTRARIVRIALDTACTFMVYDTIMEFINRVWP